MNFETYLRAVLYCYLTEVKDDIKEDIIKKILEYKAPAVELVKLDDGSVACPACQTGTSIKSIPSVIFFRYCPYCGVRLKRSEDNCNKNLLTPEFIDATEVMKIINDTPDEESK